ncbi:MAG: Spore protein [Planctomycetota bacterium]
MPVYRTWTIGPVSLSQPGEVSETVACGNPNALATQNAHLIPVRIAESDSGWIVEADIPGIDPNQVAMEYFKNRLTISYQRLADPDQKSTFDNRAYGLFQRVIRVSEEVDSESIKAVAENGVLRITLLKLTPDVPKKIVVSGP